jgi:hypothetical protein
VADEDFSGGGDNAVVTATINLTQPGINAAPMAVYQHGRSGVFTYTIPGLTAGNQYSVLLHLAETYFNTKGSREFNVAINGTTVLTNLDIYATVGLDAALLESFTATANSSGQIVIAFSAGAADQPLVMGIEIRGGSGSCSAVPSAPAGLTTTATSSSAISVSWSAVTPARQLQHQRLLGLWQHDQRLYAWKYEPHLQRPDRNHLHEHRPYGLDYVLLQSGSSRCRGHFGSLDPGQQHYACGNLFCGSIGADGCDGDGQARLV